MKKAIELLCRATMSARDKESLIRMLQLHKCHAAYLSGPELKEVRENAGLSRGQAAELLGITRDDLDIIEKNPSYMRLFLCLPLHMDQIYGIGRPEVQP